MSPDLSVEFEHLRQGGWRCIENTVPIEWPAAIVVRYPWIPRDISEAMAGLMEVVSPDQKCWLLTSREYAGDSDSVFAWNEWEQQSIEAAGDDLEWIRQIELFWDKHLPIALSVRDGYGYFALREDGSVVGGQEPDFEGTAVVASSYSSFLSLLAEETGKGFHSQDPFI